MRYGPVVAKGRPYNGFSALWRHKIATQVKAVGLVWRRYSCDACTTVPALPHSEDYAQIETAGAYTLCRRCHHAVHTRHRNPGNWHRKKAAAARIRGGRTVLDDIEASLRFPSVESLRMIGMADVYAALRPNYLREVVDHPEPPTPPAPTPTVALLPQTTLPLGCTHA